MGVWFGSGHPGGADSYGEAAPVQTVGASGNYWEPVGASGKKWELLEASGNQWKQVGTSRSQCELVRASGKSDSVDEEFSRKRGRSFTSGRQGPQKVVRLQLWASDEVKC